jgi:hypothetical protein
MQKGFFGSLFDLSFSSLITTSVIKVLYVLTLIGIGLTALGFIVVAFKADTAFGVVTLLILAPLASLFYVIYARVILEFIIVVFRIAEYNRDMLALARHEAVRTDSARSTPVG